MTLHLGTHFLVQMLRDKYPDQDITVRLCRVPADTPVGSLILEDLLEIGEIGGDGVDKEYQLGPREALGAVGYPTGYVYFVTEYGEGMGDLICPDDPDDPDEEDDDWFGPAHAMTMAKVFPVFRYSVIGWIRKPDDVEEWTDCFPGDRHHFHSITGDPPPC